VILAQRDPHSLTADSVHCPENSRNENAKASSPDACSYRLSSTSVNLGKSFQAPCARKQNVLYDSPCNFDKMASIQFAAFHSLMRSYSQSPHRQPLMRHRSAGYRLFSSAVMSFMLSDTCKYFGSLPTWHCQFCRLLLLRSARRKASFSLFKVVAKLVASRQPCDLQRSRMASKGVASVPFRVLAKVGGVPHSPSFCLATAGISFRT